MNQRTRPRTPDSAAPHGWVAAVDRELVALSRGGGALRLALGDGLALLRRTGGAADLGFPDLGAYTLERLGRRRRWAEDTARVAEQLAALPLIRAALADGHLGWSMAELLAREATPETEVALLETALATTVRGMRAHLAAAKAEETVDESLAPDPEPDDERRTLQVTVARVTAWAYELTRRFLAAQTGASSDDAVVEALLAEALVTLQVRHPALKRELAASARATAWDQQRELTRRFDELTAEDRFHRDLPDPALVTTVARAVAAATAEVAPPPRDPSALDAHLRDLNTQLQRRDGRLGELARRLWGVDGWSHLGYASPAQYANERLGCSLAAIKARMTLDRRCDLLPEVARALDVGAVGFEAARLVSRVANRHTVRAWLDRAGVRTVKHLEEEVEAVETIARAEGAAPYGLAPPDDETLNAYLDLERAMLDGTVAELLVSGGQMSGDDGSQSTPAFGTPPEPSQMSGAGRVPLRLRLGAGIVAFWRDVEAWFRAAGEDGEFADFLIRTFWHEWLVQDPTARVAYQDVYERERFRCASPVCSNRDLTPHHLVFRSHGGGEERSNILGLCLRCHLDLLHQGRLRAAPPADDVRWTLGREGWLTVQGRTVAQVASDGDWSVAPARSSATVSRKDITTSPR